MIAVTCSCGQTLSVRDRLAGKQCTCPSCGRMLSVPAQSEEISAPNLTQDVLAQLIDIRNLLQAATAETASTEKILEYKVLTQKDKWFTQKFDPERLEEAINAFAEQGWQVKSVTTGSFGGLMGVNREELVVVFEREADATRQDGVLFVEGQPAGCRILSPINTELGGVFAQAQLKSLRDLKAKMALRVKELGGDAVVNFRYGQRSVGALRSIWQLDDVNWYGSGEVAVLKRAP